MADSNYCDKHPNERIQFYCDDCDMLVCGDCITDELCHKKHSISKLNTIADRKKRELTEMLSTGKDEIITDLTSLCNGYRQMLDDLLKLEKQMGEKMSERAEKMKKDIDSLRELNLKKLRELIKFQNVPIVEIKTQTNELMTEICELSDKMEIVNDMTDVQVIRLQISLKQKLIKMKSSDIKTRVNIPSFTEEEMFEKSLEKAYGCIESEAESASDYQVVDNSNELIAVSITYKHPCYDGNQFIGSISTIHFTGEDSAWLLTNNKGLLNAESLLNNEVKCVLGNYVGSMLTYSGELMVIESQSYTVSKITPDGKKVVWSNFSPLHPWYLCPTKTDNVIVSMFSLINNGRYDDGFYYRKYVTMKFDKVGRKISELFSEDRNIQALHMVVNSDGNLCVVEDKGGFILNIYDSRGIYLSCFGGILGPDPPKNFSISGICCDKNGRIIVSDSRNNMLYLLDSHGKFIDFIIRERPEIRDLDCVVLDRKERLWINAGSKLYIFTNWEPKT